ncbi:MAG: arylsulfatase A-like enzyme [Myxococcota bacterium]|jgi:arylsulfatase A-like enzyme
MLPLLLLSCDTPPPPTGPPNLILISIDGLRADHVGIHGRSPSPTPTLDALAADGLVFSQSFSQGNESLYSHAAMFTGRHVSEVAAPDYRTYIIPDSAMLISEVLALYGYQTAGFLAGGHVHESYGFNQGFAHFDDSADFGSFFNKVPYALSWLDTQEPTDPFFLILHGYDCHRPYAHPGAFFHAFGADYTGDIDTVLTDRQGTEQIFSGVHYPDFELDHFSHEVGDLILNPEGYLRIGEWAEGREGTALSDEDLDHIDDHYDTGVLSADLQVGRFLDGLKARGLWENTLVLITSDHGEDLGDHGIYNHRITLTDSTTRVPMLLTGGALPEALRGTTQDGLVQAIDVVPTLLSASGATLPASLPGRDLLSEAPAPSVVFQEGVLDMVSARTPTHRLLFRGVPLTFEYFEMALRQATTDSEHFILYDLRSDPGEQVNVAAAQPEVVEQLRGELLTWWRGMDRSDYRGSQPQSASFREILKARGYW